MLESPCFKYKYIQLNAKILGLGSLETFLYISDCLVSLLQSPLPGNQPGFSPVDFAPAYNLSNAFSWRWPDHSKKDSIHGNGNLALKTPYELTTKLQKASSGPLSSLWVSATAMTLWLLALLCGHKNKWGLGLTSLALWEMLRVMTSSWRHQLKISGDFA